MAFRIIFWLLIVGLIVYFVVRWAQSEAVINNQASGLSSVEVQDGEDQDQEVLVPRISGSPVAFQPQKDIHEIAQQLREQASEDGTQETPVYLGEHSSVLPVHLK